MRRMTALRGLPQAAAPMGPSQVGATIDSFIDHSSIFLPPFCHRSATVLRSPRDSSVVKLVGFDPLRAVACDFPRKVPLPTKKSPARPNPPAIALQISPGKPHTAKITRQTSRGGHGPKRPWGQPRAKCASINSFPIASFAAKLLWARQSSRKFPTVFCPPNARGVT